MAVKVPSGGGEGHPAPMEIIPKQSIGYLVDLLSCLKEIPLFPAFAS